MSSQYLAILLGGIIPAICFGITGILAKASIDKGIDTASYLFCVGAAVIIDGIILTFLVGQRSYNLSSCLYAAGVGLIWGVGISLFTYVLTTYKSPVSGIVPFHSAAILVSVVIAFVVFSEWKTVNVPLLLMGATLMAAGSVLVAKAQ